MTEPDNAEIFEKIRQQLVTRRKRERLQKELWLANDDFHETIRTKLDGLFEDNQFTNFSRCGVDKIVRRCRGCGDSKTLPYQCSIKWCPRCNWKITKKRSEMLKAWTTRIQQPKHLVLTQRNFPVLTRKKIRQHTCNLAKMRRSKCMREVRRRCCSVGITNEKKGWHLHSHWLIDARWLPMSEGSIRWGKITGQEFAIVKVKDLRDQEYRIEVAKYVVEGSELARWHPELIHQFVRAIKGLRFFFSFGTLRELAPQIRAELAAMKPEQPPCECGCCDFIYKTEFEDEVSSILRECS